MKNFFAILFLFLVSKCIAQESLPKFNAIVFSDTKAQISWKNTYSNCIQISVQRSYDSLRFFQTIFSAQSPQLPQNGYTDNNYLAQIKMYYRIFYVLDDGRFFFTESKTATKNATQKTESQKQFDVAVTTDTTNIKFVDLVRLPLMVPAKKIYCIYKQNTDSPYLELEEKNYYKFKDSIARKTKDTLYAFSNDVIVWKPFVPKPLWKPSLHIFTSEKGYVTIQLPLVKVRRYKLVFFEENGREIFKIKHLKYEKMILDKTNFIHAGWFYFELYEDDKLKEKNHFLIDKDF